MADRKPNAEQDHDLGPDPAPQQGPEHASLPDRAQDRLPGRAYEPENGPSLTVAHLRKAAERLHPRFGSPLIEALDALPLASDLLSLYSFAWMTRVDFFDGITTWTLFRDEEGRWKQDEDHERRGDPKGVVPQDAAFFYEDIVESLRKLKTQLRRSKVALPRHALNVDAARAILHNVLTGGYLLNCLTVDKGEDGALWVCQTLVRSPQDADTRRQTARASSELAADPASSAVPAETDSDAAPPGPISWTPSAPPHAKLEVRRTRVRSFKQFIGGDFPPVETALLLLADRYECKPMTIRRALKEARKTFRQS